MASPVERSGSVDQVAYASEYREIRGQLDKCNLSYVLDRLPPETHVERAEFDRGTGRFSIHHHEIVVVSVRNMATATEVGQLTVAKIVSGRISLTERRLDIDPESLVVSRTGLRMRLIQVSSDGFGNLSLRANITIGGFITREVTQEFCPGQEQEVTLASFSLKFDPELIRPDYRPAAAPPPGEPASGGGWFSGF